MESNFGEIDGNKAYTLKRLMDLLGWEDEPSARRNLLHADPPLRWRKVGRQILVTGESFIHWLQSAESFDGRPPDGGNEDDGPAPAPVRRPRKR